MDWTRRDVLLGGAAGLIGSQIAGVDAAAAAGAAGIRYGWKPDAPLDTQPADGHAIHVAPHGDDSAAGTQNAPLRTVQAGVDRLAAMSGGSLLIHGGLYREAVHLDGLRGSASAPYTIRRFGAAPVTITAADRLTGWTRCTPDDLEGLGETPPGLFCARIPRSDIAHGAHFALNLHDTGHWQSIATDRADISQLEYAGDDSTFHLGEFLTDPDTGVIRAIRDERLRGRDPSALSQARVLVYHRPNVVGIVGVSGFDPVSGTLTVDRDNMIPQSRNGQVAAAYALQNVAWSLRPGQWIVREQGDELLIVLKPRHPNGEVGEIEISTRAYCLDFGRASHVTLEGIEFVRAAGAQRDDGVCVRRKIVKGGGQGLTIRNCRMGENLTSDGSCYGGLYLSGATGLSLQHLSIGPCVNSFGMFLSKCQDVDMRYLHIDGASKSPGRFFGLKNAVLAFCLFENSARDAHANKFNFYLGSDRILVYGVKTHNTGGYATYQQASRIFFAFCQLDCEPTSNNRALVSQNFGPGRGRGGEDGSGDPVVGATFHYWNNTLESVRGAPSPANSLILGPGSSSQHHAIHNNILNGGGVAHIYTKGADPALETRSHNHYTGLSYWQQARRGWYPGEGETVGDISEAASLVGRDMSQVIATEIAPLFPGFTDWNVDIDGRPFSWQSPPIGCAAS